MTGSDLQFPDCYYCTVSSSFVLTCVHVKRHVVIRMVSILIYSHTEEK